MNEILKMAVNEMAGTNFKCECGREHCFPLDFISVGKGAFNDLPKKISVFKDGAILVVSDNNTYKVAGKDVADILKRNGYKVDELIFDCGKNVLIPDERTLGRILMDQDEKTSLMIAVGSGVINDSVKFVTSRTKIPYVVVATAPSMDGYVSDGAPIIKQGYKYSPKAHLCYGLIGDVDRLTTAPQDLIEAGFGDIVGKLTALADWDLSVKVNGEYRCPTCVALVEKAINKCFSLADGLKTRDEKSIAALFEALTLTGVAMALINNSRPASGAEHMLSHFWEMDYIAKGANPIHHGIQVGVASVVIAKIFDNLKDILPYGVTELCVSDGYIIELLKRAGAPYCPKEIGIDRKLFYESLINAYAVRPRYSVLKFAKDNGKLEKIAEEITAEIYG